MTGNVGADTSLDSQAAKAGAAPVDSAVIDEKVEAELAREFVPASSSKSARAMRRIRNLSNLFRWSAIKGTVARIGQNVAKAPVVLDTTVGKMTTSFGTAIDRFRPPLALSPESTAALTSGTAGDKDLVKLTSQKRGAVSGLIGAGVLAALNAASVIGGSVLTANAGLVDGSSSAASTIMNTVNPYAVQLRQLRYQYTANGAEIEQYLSGN